MWCIISLIFVIFIIFLVLISYLVCGNWEAPNNYTENQRHFYEPLTELPIVKKIKPMKICVFVVATDDIMNYAKYSIPLINKWCEQHGYDLRIFDKLLDKSIPINFTKIIATIDLMNEKVNGKNKYDYIMHIDADAPIINFDYPIENIIQTYMKGIVSTLFSEDCYNKKICSKPGRQNSGVYIVHNGYWGKKVMQKWIDSAKGDCSKYVNKFPNCQLVLWNCVVPKYFFTITTLPYNILNGIDGLLVTHQMQKCLRERIDAIKKIYNEEFDVKRMQVFI
jgi:hypothetical protein